MDAVAAALGAGEEASGPALAAAIAAQFALWLVVFHAGEPLLRQVLAISPLGRRYADFQTQSGKPVLREISASTLVALQHGASAALVAAAAARGGRDGAGFLRLGLASEVAFRLNDILGAVVGLSRHADLPKAVRGMFVGHHVLAAILLCSVAFSTLAADSDVQQICRVLMCSGAGLAFLVPVQYAFDLLTYGGFNVVFYLQLAAFLSFSWSRLIWGLSPRSGAYMRVLKTAYGSGVPTCVFFAVALVMALVHSGFMAKLLFQRLQRSRHAGKKVKTIRQWFAKNQPDTDEEKIRAHTWKSQKLAEALFAMPPDMLAARLKAGPLCPKRKGKLG